MKEMEDVTRHDGGAAVFARVSGALACGGAAALWLILLFANPYGEEGMGAGTLFVAGAMIVLAVVGAVASILGEPFLMGAVAVISLFPVGLYLLGTPGIFLGIGLCDLILLAAATLLYRAERRHRLANLGGSSSRIDGVPSGS
jgi:hypothetical protein